ncbi:unnamed protein product [Rhizophagus irregularis]|nr:unnamed protein product [Rhizophagus irregularis]CAB4419384.1 unnamed protein product [Rhizophagus irregularis]
MFISILVKSVITINNGFAIDIRSENSDINYHNVNTPRDYNNGCPVMNDGVFPASYTNTPYTNTPAYIDTPGNVINSDLSQFYPPVSSAI